MIHGRDLFKEAFSLLLWRAHVPVFSQHGVSAALQLQEFLVQHDRFLFGLRVKQILRTQMAQEGECL